VDDKGLLYRFEAPKTALGDELLEGLRRKDISTSSFAFIVDTDNWEKRSDGSYLRTIKSIKELFDVSAVYKAAYNATSVNTRGLDDLKQKEQLELDNYYKDLENKLKV
jgi:HK97 family phage prohead protease